MGRKKKVIEPQQTQTNVEIKDSSKYSGSVNIRLVKNGKTIQNINQHNEGNLPLFSFLINCLNGYLNEKGIPNYISLGTTDSGTKPYKPYTNYKLKSSSSFIVNKPINNVNYPSINYQFTVPTILLNSDNDLSIDTLRLYNLENVDELGDNWSAQIILNDPIEINKDDLPKYTIYITWSLAIIN